MSTTSLADQDFEEPLDRNVQIADPIDYSEDELNLGKDVNAHQITMMIGDLEVRDSLEGHNEKEIIYVDSVPTECTSEFPFESFFYRK